MFTPHLDNYTMPEACQTERMPVVVERIGSSLTFHVAQHTEFIQGVTDGRQMLPTDWDLTGKNGWWEVEDLLLFMQRELSPASLKQANERGEHFEAEPPLPVYHLGLIAGLLSTFAEAAMKASANQRRES